MNKKLKESIIQFLYYFELLEELSIYTDISHTNVNRMIKKLFHHFHLPLEYLNQTYYIVISFLNSNKNIEKIIYTYSRSWLLKELAIVDYIIVKISIYEIIIKKQEKKKVINEALELSKCFSSFKARTVINEILNTI